MTLTRKHVSIGNFVCVVLALLLMICQFMPFWTLPESGETYSIGTLVGFPQEHPDLMDYLETSVGEGYNINSVVSAPALIIVLGAVTVVLCLWKNGSAACALVPTTVGVIGIWGYLSQTALRLGSGWPVHLIFSIALLIAGVATIYIGVKTAEK